MPYPPEEGLTWAKNLLRAGRSYSLLEQEKSISWIKGVRVAGAGALEKAREALNPAEIALSFREPCMGIKGTCVSESTPKMGT